MSQAEAAKIQAIRWSETWNDLDFYLLKLDLDRFDKIGFWYYLLHPRQAWRDFWLARRFKKLVKTIDAKKPDWKRPSFKIQKERDMVFEGNMDVVMALIEERLKDYLKVEPEDIVETEEAEKPVDEKDKKE